MLSTALSFTAAAVVVVVRTTHSAVKMSAGDVVCTGWLIKSPPEKKLKRFTWRKRWFVLRRGRMSGNPDVLEYYQSKSSKKPIRTIDLRECEVQMQSGQLRIKREFHEKHLFVVKTSFRIFYLVAKTEEEMNSWIKSISQICQFMPLDDAESSEEGFPHTPTSHQPSPANCDTESESSQPECSDPPDYLFLAHCETGSSISISRHDSFSNSENSLEQKSSDDTDKDIIPSPVCTKSASFSFSHAGPFPSLVNHRGLINPPLSAPCTLMAVTSSSSPPLPPHCASSIFQFDKPYSSASFEATADRQTPPPLPPKPSHFSEQLNNEGAHRLQAMSAHQPSGHTLLIPSGISLSGLDRLGIGDVETGSVRNKKHSLNLPCLNSPQVPYYEDHSYVPMASPVTAAASDGYIPMSPGTFTLLNSICAAESSMISQATHQLTELAPPPIHRHLKPRRRARPPPLDLRGLSSISEFPTHLPLTRTMTAPCKFLNSLPLGSRHEGWDYEEDEDPSYTTTDSKQELSPTCDGAFQPLARRLNLDYLLLDFNSASPSPVQKKPVLFDEHKVDYVQVDEKKTQALQNTKMEWKDVRQSKT